MPGNIVHDHAVFQLILYANPVIADTEVYRAVGLDGDKLNQPRGYSRYVAHFCGLTILDWPRLKRRPPAEAGKSDKHGDFAPANCSSQPSNL